MSVVEFILLVHDLMIVFGILGTVIGLALYFLTTLIKDLGRDG